MDQVEKRQSKYKVISQDQSPRIAQLEESLEKKCTAVAKLSAKLEMVQAALRLAEGRVRELVMTSQSRESVLSSLREEWAGQERRMRADHQVNRVDLNPTFDSSFSGPCSRFVKRNGGDFVEKQNFIKGKGGAEGKTGRREQGKFNYENKY